MRKSDGQWLTKQLKKDRKIVAGKIVDILYKRGFSKFIYIKSIRSIKPHIVTKEELLPVAKSIVKAIEE